MGSIEARLLGCYELRTGGRSPETRTTAIGLRYGLTAETPAVPSSLRIHRRTKVAWGRRQAYARKSRCCQRAERAFIHSDRLGGRWRSSGGGTGSHAVPAASRQNECRNARRVCRPI